MKISLSLIFGSLGLAVLATALIESRLSRRLGKQMASRFAMLALLCCYGVCVGAVSAVVAYFFIIPEWVALVIAVPLGIPLLILASKIH
jgi:di/tricarboxylate transporter